MSHPLLRVIYTHVSPVIQQPTQFLLEKCCIKESYIEYSSGCQILSNVNLFCMKNMRFLKPKLIGQYSKMLLDIPI